MNLCLYHHHQQLCRTHYLTQLYTYNVNSRIFPYTRTPRQNEKTGYLHVLVAVTIVCLVIVVVVLAGLLVRKIEIEKDLMPGNNTVNSVKTYTGCH